MLMTGKAIQTENRLVCLPIAGRGGAWVVTANGTSILSEVIKYSEIGGDGYATLNILKSPKL